jgi:ribose-phosphate pyrophosphokinase
MINLNLVNPKEGKEGTLKYEISRFPDGQQSFRLIEEGATSASYLSFEKDIQDSTEPIYIQSRLNSFKDLEILICAVHAIRNIKNCEIELFVPYFLGSRSDRKFTRGGVNYLKQVICPIINSLNFSKVEVLDPHSDVLEACLNNYEKIDNYKLVRFGLNDIQNSYHEPGKICLVSPDAGAYKKIFDVAQKFNIKNIATATKVRDLITGQILRTEVPNLPVSISEEELKYVIIDDICDGGRTFIELAKVIKEQRPNAKIYLIVTHGIFSAGYSQLGEYFEQIYTTNSYKEIKEAEFHGSELLPTKVNQFNVF